MDDQLLEHAKHTREQLEAAKITDTDKRDMVGHLLTDIILEIRSGELDESRRDKLSEQLREQAAHFEVEHPKLAAAVERLATMLGNLGI